MSSLVIGRFLPLLLLVPGLAGASLFSDSIRETKLPEDASPFSRFRLEVVVPGDVGAIAAKAWELVNDPDFVGEHQTKTVWTNDDGTTVSRVVFSSPGFFLGEQDVVTCSEKLAPEGEVHVIVWSTCEDERVPVDPDIDRIPASDGFWAFSHRGAAHTAIVMEGHTAPDVPFPAAVARLVDRFVLDGMRDEIARLAERVATPKTVEN